MVVDRFQNELKELGENMIATMFNACGVGLAAPQVGVLLRAIVVDPALGKNVNSEPIIMVNPEIKETGTEIFDEEGCLSLPGLYSYFPRPEKIVVSYLDLEGNSCIYETKGMVARVVLHEIDHLNGKLFWNRLSILNRLWLKFMFHRKNLS